MDVDTTTTTYQQTTTPTNPIIPREVITNKKQDFTCHSELSELPHDLVPNQSQNDLSGQQVDRSGISSQKTTLISAQNNHLQEHEKFVQEHCNNESPISTTPAENHEILPYPPLHAVEEHGNTIVASFNKMATRSQSRALLSKKNPGEQSSSSSEGKKEKSETKIYQQHQCYQRNCIGKFCF
jgi:hypothetical protein